MIGEKRRFWSVLLGGLLLASSLAAQVNTEKLRVGADEPGVSGSFSLDLALRDGNSEVFLLGAGFRVGHVKASTEVDDEGLETQVPRRVLFLVSRYDFSEQDGEKGVNRAFSHLRWVQYRHSRFALEAFAQHQFDDFQRLDTRWLLGAGGRFALRQEDHFDLFLGAGYMFEFERLEDSFGNLEDRESRHHRLTTYLTARFEKEERFAFISTLYVQPRVDRWDDLRILEEAEVEVMLGNRISLGLALSVQHDSDPPMGVKDTDIALTNRLRIRLGGRSASGA